MSESSAQRHQRRVIDAHVSHSKLAKAHTVVLMVLDGQGCKHTQ